MNEKAKEARRAYKREWNRTFLLTGRIKRRRIRGRTPQGQALFVCLQRQGRKPRNHDRRAGPCFSFTGIYGKCVHYMYYMYSDICYGGLDMV